RRSGDRLLVLLRQGALPAGPRFGQALLQLLPGGGRSPPARRGRPPRRPILRRPGGLVPVRLGDRAAARLGPDQPVPRPAPPLLAAPPLGRVEAVPAARPGGPKPPPRVRPTLDRKLLEQEPEGLLQVGGDRPAHFGGKRPALPLERADRLLPRPVIKLLGGVV